MENKDIIIEKEDTAENTEAEIPEIDEPTKRFMLFTLCESIILLIVLFICRKWAFPPMAKKGMLHVEIATHAFSIGLMATLFSAFALTFRKAWHSHGRYIVYPIIFMMFGALLLGVANEINFDALLK